MNSAKQISFKGKSINTSEFEGKAWNLVSNNKLNNMESSNNKLNPTILHFYVPIILAFAVAIGTIILFW